MGGVFAASAGALINSNCTISSVLTVGIISPPIASGLTLNGYRTTKIALGNTVAITGNVSMPGFLFCAGVVGATGTKYNATGQVSFTVARLSGYAAGVWTVTFASAHPLGANYVVTTTARNAQSYISVSPIPTANAFVVVLLAPGTSTPPVDTPFSFTVANTPMPQQTHCHIHTHVHTRLRHQSHHDSSHNTSTHTYTRSSEKAYTPGFRSLRL